MKLKLGGFTAVGVLVLALGAGAAGGAIAFSAAQGGNPAAPPAAVTLHQVADEATPAPSAGPVVAEVDENTVAAPAVVQSEKSAPVVAAPKVAVVEGESAQEAADRAAAEADRAEKAADRAEETSPDAPTAPVGSGTAVIPQEEAPVPKPTVAPVASHEVVIAPPPPPAPPVVTPVVEVQPEVGPRLGSPSGG